MNNRICATAVILVAASGNALAQVPFDGRIGIVMREQWRGPPGSGLPSLVLEVTSTQHYASTGYCLHVDTVRSANDLVINLQSVSRCHDIVGHIIAPAYWELQLARGDTTHRAPRVIRFRFLDREDAYGLSVTPRTAQLTRISRAGVVDTATTMPVTRMQVNTLMIGCFAQYQNMCLCDGFRLVAMYRGHLSPIIPPSAWTGSRAYEAREAIRDTALAAAAADFSRVFDGRNSDASTNPTFQVEIVYWDGRRLNCYRGNCTGAGTAR
jgi:hypothetical protein